MRGSLVFYRSFADAAKYLPDEERLQFFDSLVAYALDGIEPELVGAAAGMFLLVRPQIDANNRKYENGKKGGRPANESIGGFENQTETKPKPNDNQDITTTEPNVNDNANANVSANEKGNASTEVDVWLLFKNVLTYLNEQAGTSYKTDDVNSVRLITGLSQKGYTEEQMKTVIDKKVGSWLGDPKVEQYLRPSTLFGPKFEQYLSEPDSARKRKQDEDRKREQNKVRYREAIKSYQEQISAIDEKMKDAGVAEKVELRGQKAVLEARLNDLERATS